MMAWQMGLSSFQTMKKMMAMDVVGMTEKMITNHGPLIWSDWGW